VVAVGALIRGMRSLWPTALRAVIVVVGLFAIVDLVL
jgi:hypothetical protein